MAELTTYCPNCANYGTAKRGQCKECGAFTVPATKPVPRAVTAPAIVIEDILDEVTAILAIDPEEYDERECYCGHTFAEHHLSAHAAGCTKCASAYQCNGFRWKEA
jgi:hypothetical protein